MLAINNLTIARGGAVLAQNITRTVDAGTTLLLTGANGTGKTSLLRAMAGLLKPTGGAMTAPDFYWLSAQAIPPSLETPRDYLAFHAALADNNAHGPDIFSITEKLDTPFNQLSTGWRQRVKLTRLTQTNAKLWLLDEPSDGLDDNGIKALQNLIADHNGKGGMAVIATHQPQLWPKAETMHFEGAA